MATGQSSSQHKNISEALSLLCFQLCQLLKLFGSEFSGRGGQVLTSARLRLLGSRVEAVLMSNFSSQLADAARLESKRLADAGAAVKQS